jgi:hypothetical protein
LFEWAGAQALGYLQNTKRQNPRSTREKRGFKVGTVKIIGGEKADESLLGHKTHTV